MVRERGGLDPAIIRDASNLRPDSVSAPEDSVNLALSLGYRSPPNPPLGSPEEDRLPAGGAGVTLFSVGSSSQQKRQDPETRSEGAYDDGVPG